MHASMEQAGEAWGRGGMGEGGGMDRGRGEGRKSWGRVGGELLTGLLLFYQSLCSSCDTTACLLWTSARAEPPLERVPLAR